MKWNAQRLSFYDLFVLEQFLFVVGFDGYLKIKERKKWSRGGGRFTTVNLFYLFSKFCGFGDRICDFFHLILIICQEQNSIKNFASQLCISTTL